MNRIDRLQAILIQLQGKRIVRAHEIADRFEISLRTVYRDIRSLEEAGVPIGAEAGVGYFLMEHYQLPPVSFTSDEATALLFGEKLIEKMSDMKVRTDFCSALYKIKAILKPDEKDKLEKLQQHIKVLNYRESVDENQQLFLNEIQQALVQKQVLEIEYEAKFADKGLIRQVEPLGLCNYSSRWHLIAWCRLRNDFRDFRLDRIHSLSMLSEFFHGKQHPSLDDYMKTITPKGGIPNISILISKEKKNWIDDSKYWYGYVGEEKVDDDYRIFFANDELKGFGAWMLNTGCLAVIEKPIELKVIICQFVERSFQHYCG